MAPQRKVTMEQLEILVNYFESYKHLVGKSRRQTLANNMLVQEKWLAVSKKLNAIKGGAVRSPEQWRRYFTEWTSKCRKKATNSLKNNEKTVSLNDTEIRLLHIVGKVGMTDITKSSSASNEADNFKDEYTMDIKNECSDQEFVFADDFNTEEIRNRSKSDKQIDSADEDTSLQKDAITSNEKSCATPPPQWALDLEERRVASQEKMADALQSIASTLHSQEQRREMLDLKIVNSLTTLASKIQDLTSGIQDALQNKQECRNASNKKDGTGNEVAFI